MLVSKKKKIESWILFFLLLFTGWLTGRLVVLNAGMLAAWKAGRLEKKRILFDKKSMTNDERSRRFKKKKFLCFE
ncbi:hypothetical protein Phum_PHUM558640 [Pediculus humanus corporis]|uniref:Uncharacterized protein n=1 Tax=Pediculus humanus subsp. corporis TaxID=121224 RepID=E0W0L1_PEDHC|nr:uncharacterized protein Phum_PHUM558640 [Pediculus humanus corporis]EEB19167.1 hypothetical protein Phum_PHUM558640 [Pediculus humanus corporis]